MTAPLNCIMLIEDCEADNFLHKKIIRDVGAAADVVVATCGDEALKRIGANRSARRSQPELIFLDINTPGMEGWDFVEEFEKLDDATKEGTVIVMLSGSLNPDDQARARSIPLIKDYRPKPLTREALREIIATHFARRPGDYA